MRATVAFAAGETKGTLCGCARANPCAFVRTGATNNLTCKSTPFKPVIAALLCALGFCIDSARAWQSDNGNGTFNNPVLYADYPDPDIVRVTNDFYMVSTTFVDSPGINVLHSMDLVNWEMVGHCCTNLDWSPLYNMVGGTAYRQGFWASSIRYYNGTFYVLANPVGANARMYYATNAAGPWQYYQLNQGLYDPGFLIDTNGAGYIFYGYSPQQSVAALNANFSQIVAVSNNVVLSGGEGSTRCGSEIIIIFSMRTRACGRFNFFARGRRTSLGRGKRISSARTKFAAGIKGPLWIWTTAGPTTTDLSCGMAGRLGG